MKKYLYLSAAMSLALFACTNDETLNPDDNSQNNPSEQENAITTLKSAQLTSTKSSQDRVTVFPLTRSIQEANLTLIAEIENPSSEIPGFVHESRDMSATCVFYDVEESKYYVTYHMQGNNYSTTQTVSTKGFIETFTLNPQANEEGLYELDLNNLYYASDNNEDFDFNHLYFDKLDDTYLTYSGNDKNSKRLIAVGHRSRPNSKDNSKDETYAIIANLNLTENKIDYSTVYTGDELRDENGRLLSRIDAGDVNCVIRKSNYYYLATRKGLAVLNAKDDNLFTPIHNYVPSGEFTEDGREKLKFDEESVYFIKTPGSAKHLTHMEQNSHFSFLYLEDPGTTELTAKTSAKAHIIDFSMETGGGTVCGSNTSDSKTDGPAILNSSDITDLTTWSPNVNQMVIDEEMVYPVDGKNVLAFIHDQGTHIACLGKGGLYVNNPDTHHKEVIKFSDAKEGGSRPVNGVFVDPIEYFDGGRAHNGFIYVANGACLTILDYSTLEKVAEFSAFEEDKEISANYVHVTKVKSDTNDSCDDRIITVAYGQGGVKVFKFIPPTLK